MMPEPTQLGLDGREAPVVAPPVPESAPSTPVGLFDGAAFAQIRGQLPLEAACPYGCDRGRLAQWGDPRRAITCPGCQL